MSMTIKIVIALSIGIVSGNRMNPDIIEFISGMTNPLLYLLLFFAGLSMGYAGNIKENFKSIGFSIIFVPVLTMLGSLLGAFVAGLLVNMESLDVLAVGAGFGWYSLSAVLIAEYDASLAAVALMTNVFREIIAIIGIPLIAKNIGYLEAVASGGATTMDTTMPSISASTDSATVIVAFFSGFIISMSVPFVVQFFLILKYGV